jgi:hypothetical protein
MLRLEHTLHPWVAFLIVPLFALANAGVTITPDVLGIPPEMVVGHYRVNEKSDPGPALNLFWERPGNPPRPAIFTP